MTPQEELLALSRDLGRPERDYVVLAEGNTSTLLEDGTFLVKASGARLGGIGPGDFVRLRLEPLLAAVLGGGPADVRALFREARAEPSPGSGDPSIETFVHVACLALAGARWVAHTHPTVLTGLLCSPVAEEILLAGPLFPDEVVVCGPAPVFVPYAEPGLPLARALAPRLRAHEQRFAAPARVVLLANHGLVALGASPAEAEAVTAMAVKAARIRTGALAAGGLRTLAAASVEELGGRRDEVERRARLVGGAT
jgi:rhamnose utilization protein RhaD (predicted bifunctional aldolase and dehydrogenase)